MKQEIRHGSMIDTATPVEVAQLLAAAKTAERPTQYQRYKAALNLDATGAAKTTSQTTGAIIVPSQYDLLLERVTFGGSGAAGALICIYENHESSDADLLEVVQLGTAGKYSDAFSNCIYVTANSQIRFVISGGIANLQVTYNLQGRLIPSA